MPIKNSNTSKFILIGLAVMVILMGVVIFITPTAIFPDPSWGFQVMRSMQLGGGFNQLVSPDPTDISKNAASFLSWWSPGQYLMPYLFKSLFSFNSAQAIAITITLGHLIGLAGFYSFFKKLGFSNWVSAVSLLFIVLQQAFWVPYAFYTGGEILLFAFEGWFLYGCVTVTKPDVKLLVFVLLSGWIGFICKSSFMWIYVSGLLCLWIRLSTGQTTVWGWIKKGFWLGIPAVVSIATIFVFYLSKGENPASASGGFKLSFEAFAYPMASPLLSGFSVDDLLNGLIYRNEAPVFTPGQTTAVLFLLAAVSLAIVILIYRNIPHKNYRLFVAAFYGVSIMFFANSFLRQAAISYEGRHFRMIGLLIVPGVIYLTERAKRYGQVAFVVLCLAIGYKSYTFTKATRHGDSLGSFGPSGISQQFIDQPTLNYILALDKQNSNAIFAFISADIGLEIQHNRIITVDPFDDSDTADDIVPYKGHAGPIYFLLPAEYSPQKAAVMFKYFPGYKNFTAITISKNYVLYKAQ